MSSTVAQLDSPYVLWYVLDNAVIALAYFAIPFAIFKRNRTLRVEAEKWWRSLKVIFTILICSSGAGRVLNILLVWYRLETIKIVIDTASAVAAVGAAYMLVRYFPRYVALVRTQSELLGRVDGLHECITRTHGKTLVGSAGRRPLQSQ